MTCDPSQTITSQDMTNLKADITTIDTVVESSEDTTVTKDGKTINTLFGQLKLLGWQTPPIAYAGGLSFTTNDGTKVIERSGLFYAPLPSLLPFTTSGTWAADDEDKFHLILYATADNTGLDIGGINTNVSVYLNSDDVATYAALQAIDVSTVNNYRTVNIAERTAGNGGGGAFYWLNSDQSGEVASDPLYGKYLPPSSDLTGASGAWIRKGFDAQAISLKWFGGIGGTDTANAAVNTAALEAAIDLVAGPVNSLLGGEINLGSDEWVFAEITIDEKWGWQIAGNGQKTYHTGPINILGGAGYKISNFFPESTTSRTHDGFVFGEGSTTGERNHNFVIEDITPSKFTNAMHAVGDISQCWFIRGQYGGNIKSFYFESGFTADHIYIVEPIFATHYGAGNAAFDMRCNNWRLVDAHFETLHYDTTTPDIRAEGQRWQIIGGNMTYSGGLYLGGNSGDCRGVVIHNCSTDTVVDCQSGAELSVDDMDIRWDNNAGAGVAGTRTGAEDGTGKTGISGVGWKSLDGNYIKRCGTGIYADGINHTIGPNNINDVTDTAIELVNANENVHVINPKIFLSKAAAVGISHVGGNGTNVIIDRPNFKISAGTKYAFTGAQCITIESGTGDPEGVQYGGPGSQWNRVNGGVGTSFYIKEANAASNNTGWVGK